MGRLLSPSAINLYKQCPRRFYYRYIERLETADSIHLIRGSIVHSVLEHVYDIDVADVDFEGAMPHVGRWMLRELKKEWQEASERLDALDLGTDRMTFYFDETRTMLRHWLMDFLRKLEKTGMEFPEAFQASIPLREKKVSSEQHNVMGFIDVIEMVDDKVRRVIDYKTSRKDTFTPEYELQLAIYALLINETYGHPPEEVAIHFLKFGERSKKVHPEMLELAKRECAFITEQTQSREIKDYPKKQSPLCKWENARGAGQCDFYDVCNSTLI